MTPHPFAVVLAAIAAWQIVEIWHHGSLFAGLRERSQGWGWLGDLLGCPFCFSVWVGATCAGLAVAGGWWQLPNVIFAVSRLANLANDLTHRWTRTPGRFDDDLPD